MTIKRYAVKHISVATKANGNFYGQTTIAWHGKGDHFIQFKDMYGKGFKACGYYVKEYGYTRLCDAKRNYTYNHPENTQWWKSTTQIVEMEAHDDGSVTEKVVIA